MTTTAPDDLTKLFDTHTNPIELAIFWTGAPLNISVLRVNGQKLDDGHSRQAPVARFNVPASSDGTFFVQAAIAPENGTASGIKIGMSNASNNAPASLVASKDSLNTGDNVWFVNATVTVA
jgi:hypothetical protein